MLEEVIDETIDAFHRIQTILRGRELYANAWHDHVLGYVAFHKGTERYKLKDLGLDEEYRYEQEELAKLHL